MNKMVSIIIPCFNDAQYIEQSVNSALNQTYPNIEVIVVDDGSNAETKVVLKKLVPHITQLITQENKGQSTARNVGIKAAKGEYVLVLDSDDYFEPSFCEKAVAVFKKTNDVKLVTCQANLLFENGSKVLYTPNGGSISNFINSNAALGTSMFKIEDWVACDGYDESMRKGFEDWEFFIRLLKSGGTAEVIQEPLYYYRKGKNSTTLKANKIKYELLYYIISKHEDLYNSNFKATIKYLLSLAKKNKEDELKRINSIDFRLGNKILKPLRWLKSLMK